MGYGARALQALNAYYSGEYFNLDETARVNTAYSDIATIDKVCQKTMPSSPKEAYHSLVRHASHRPSYCQISHRYASPIAKTHRA
jgi:hypothetical protein